MARRRPNQAYEFVREISTLRFDNAFNPYVDTCAEFDLPEASQIRTSNLTAVLEAAIRNGIDSIWVARDLGYRGGRRTGLALTDEAHLESHARLLQTRPLARSTRGPAMAERTAAIVWKILEAVERPIFLWNVFPLHPHSPDNELSNRAHTRSEWQACRPLLTWLLDTLHPRTVVAIGRESEKALLELGIASIPVRHPSYGGQRDFVGRLGAVYGLPFEASQNQELPWPT